MVRCRVESCKALTMVGFDRCLAHLAELEVEALKRLADQPTEEEVWETLVGPPQGLDMKIGPMECEWAEDEEDSN